jgi:hypothetical protein
MDSWLELDWSAEEVQLVEASVRDVTDSLLLGLGLVLVLLLLLAGARMPVARRRFWCALKRRAVEVEFETVGVPGLARLVAVRRCSAFEPASAIDCSRRCLDPVFRRQWEPALPIPRPQA